MKFMARGEVGVYQAQEILSNVGFHIKGVWGVEPGYSSASSLLSGLWLGGPSRILELMAVATSVQLSLVDGRS